MDLKQIKGVGPAKQEKLRLAGITTVEELARADSAAVAAKTGLPEGQVRELRQKAVGLVLVEDIKGVGPATFATLGEASAASLRELYDASAEWLSAEVRLAQARLVQLKRRTEELAERVATDARTPEGRKVLLVEAKEAGLAAAATAGAVGRKALATAQAARERIQAEAPELLLQAEAALKDARAKAKAAAAKAESALKAEAQKAKARTQRVVAQARQRLDRVA